MTSKSSLKSVDRRLKRLRTEVDAADQALIKALGARFKAVGKIGRLKLANGLPIFQATRWSEVMKARLARGKKHKLEAAFVELLFELIHREALRIQNQLLTQQKKGNRSS